MPASPTPPPAPASRTPPDGRRFVPTLTEVVQVVPVPLTQRVDIELDIDLSLPEAPASSAHAPPTQAPAPAPRPAESVDAEAVAQRVLAAVNDSLDRRLRLALAEVWQAQEAQWVQDLKGRLMPHIEAQIREAVRAETGR